MHRRSLLKLAALSTAARVTRGAATQPAEAVTDVLLITKCHLDVGFTQTQQQVIEKYFQVYFPQAIRTAQHLRATSPIRYTWTTGSWLLYEYLEQASPAERRTVEQAIAAGDIAWHALPFSWQTELLTPSLITGALALSQTLDQRFGRKTIAAKMTDVPGHTRGLVAPLAAAGIRLLDIGINAASTPPNIPELFLWQDSRRNTLAVLYHRHEYGGTLRIPGTTTAVAVEVRNDNSGPHTLEEIAAIHARLQQQFPAATIRAANLSQVAAAVEPIRATLPVITAELGDTWIYGTASDPPKVARLREITRQRQLFIDQGHLTPGDGTDRNLLRHLLLAAEHTWGTDTKSYLDNNHYRPADLAQAVAADLPGYRVMQHSWQEKRDNITAAVATLPPILRTRTEAALATLNPTRPDVSGMQPHDPAKTIHTPHFDLRIDPATGAITHLKSGATGHLWADPQHPLALVTYQTLAAADFTAFLAAYIESKEDWAPRDFGKPNIDHFNATHQEWHTRLNAASIRQTAIETQITLALQIKDDVALTTGNTAWPTLIACDLRLPHAEPCIHVTLQTFGKLANRMPEAMWLTFHPLTPPQATWTATKTGEPIILTNVVTGGARSMHAITGPIACPGFQLESLDAPLVSVAARTPLNFAFSQPTPQQGIHVCLFNNAWGTNYPQWASPQTPEDWQYRLTLTLA